MAQFGRGRGAVDERFLAAAEGEDNPWREAVQAALASRAKALAGALRAVAGAGAGRDGGRAGGSAALGDGGQGGAADERGDVAMAAGPAGVVTAAEARLGEVFEGLLRDVLLGRYPEAAGLLGAHGAAGGVPSEAGSRASTTADGVRHGT